MRNLFVFTILVLIDFITALCDQRSRGGELKCCSKKDSNCFVKTESSKFRGHTNSICYCDSHCRFTNDCCEDYNRVQKLCQAIDCKVTLWSSWTPCLGKCGYGITKRTRNIIQSPKNDGKRCPVLLEKRKCNTNKICNQGKIRDRAFILPSSYRRPQVGDWLYERILPAKKKDDTSKNDANELNPQKNSYCIHYDVKFQRRKCKKTWASGLLNGKRVCVECQSRVMKDGGCRGEGKIERKSRWEALGIPGCQGHWIRNGPIEPNCSCSQEGGYVFV